MLTLPAECHKWANLHRPGGDYVADVVADFQMIEPFLPQRVDRILDIGCGLAGIDVLLKRKYPDAILELLDGDGQDAVYGFVQVCTPYNSRAAAETLLAANGIRVDRWHDIGTTELLQADLIVSLLSWGFHYPLDAYRVSGFCVADIRRDKQTPRGAVIWRAKRSDRCAFVC